MNVSCLHHLRFDWILFGGEKKLFLVAGIEDWGFEVFENFEELI